MSVEGLRVETQSGVAIVEDLTLTLSGGEILAVVGESGSGKTTAALAMLGYARRGARIVAGSVRVLGQEMVGQSSSETRRNRGRLVSYVPQDPATALNPSMRLGDQIRAVIRAHPGDESADQRVIDVLSRVGLPTDNRFQRRYPHQISGGQQQRIAIAIALVCSPSVIVFDEPTTALDVVTQRRILEEIRRLRDELHIAMVYVSHDLAVVATVADRIAVFYAGRLVECGSSASLLSDPRHPYTRALLAAVPEHDDPRQLRGIPGSAPSLDERPPGCGFAPRCPLASERCHSERPVLAPIADGHLVACHEAERARTVVVDMPRPIRRAGAEGRPLLEVRSLSASYPGISGPVGVCHDINFEIRSGTTLAVVGESGSGKTTLARCVAGLHPRSSGELLLDGQSLSPAAGQRTPDQRRRLQMVFQNPYASLNPSHTVGESIARAAVVLLGVGGRDAAERAREMLEQVRMPARAFGRFPSELSGGERQRVAIARALVAQPDLLICDEITSALDVSVQAAIIELLESLRAELGLSLLFISHDLSVVATVADFVVVLEAGRIKESNEVSEVLTRPSDEYTRRLIEAIPRLRPIQEAQRTFTAGKLERKV